MNLSMVDPSWHSIVAGEFEQTYFQQLEERIKKQRENPAKAVYPPVDQVFAWSHLCPFEQVKVVILGQCPYHNVQQACGLAFSVPEPMPPPPSLKNIYKELVADISGFEPPSHGDLIGWAQQGVLLLNTCLTVNGDGHNSHKGLGWEKFTDTIISQLGAQRQGLIFILWGLEAQKKKNLIDLTRQHLILMGHHPSPLSVNRAPGRFFGGHYFSLTNQHLTSQGRTPINWCHLPKQGLNCISGIQIEAKARPIIFSVSRARRHCNCRFCNKNKTYFFGEKKNF